MEKTVKRFVFIMFLFRFSAIIKQPHTREKNMFNMMFTVHKAPSWTSTPVSQKTMGNRSTSLYLSLHFAEFTSLVFSWTLSLFPGEKWKDSLCSLFKLEWVKSKSQVQHAISRFPSSYHFNVNRRLWCRMYNTESRKPEWRECRKTKFI